MSYIFFMDIRRDGVQERLLPGRRHPRQGVRAGEGQRQVPRGEEGGDAQVAAADGRLAVGRHEDPTQDRLRRRLRHRSGTLK